MGRPLDIDGKEIVMDVWYWAIGRNGKIVGTGKFASTISAPDYWSFFINGTGYPPESFVYRLAAQDDAGPAPHDATKANAALAAIRAAPHNGKMFQADDVDYLSNLAVTAGNGLGAIHPNWFRAQAKLVAGTLARIAELEAMCRTEQNPINDLVYGILRALHSAEEEGVDCYRGTDEPREWFRILTDTLKAKGLSYGSQEA